MNESLTDVSSSKDYIEVVAAQLNTYAQKCSQEVIAGFELTIIKLIGGRLNAVLDHSAVCCFSMQERLVALCLTLMLCYAH